MFIKASEKGQALVLIVLGAVALFAFAALAIDGSTIFSDRRHAQNAADTAALEAALTKIRHGNWQTEGLARAASNGYDNNGSTNDVTLYNPPVDGPYQGNNQYIQVKIRSDVKTTFARVIGFNKATNHVQAVARASVPELTTWFNGQALVATMPGCKNESSWPHEPFNVNGTAGTTIINSGIFVNSDCEGAYDQGGSSSVITDKGVCVVGSADYTNTFPIPNEDCPPQNTDMYTLPNPGCGGPGEVVEVASNVYVASPGTYGGSFPPSGVNKGTLKLEKGIYCFDDGIDVAGTLDVTTNLNGNVDAGGKTIHDSESEGVFLFVRSGGITFNGGSDIQIHAIDSLSDNFPEALLNYLIYLPPSNKETIKITGGNGSTFTGTILAPNAHVMLDGGSGTVGLNSQIIGFSVAITGNGTLDINFNQSKNGWTTTQPGVELSQ
jgi:Flp pilus assembly protein TadG